MTFRAKIEIAGVNPYVLVSCARAAKVRTNWRRPMPVLVRINGKPETPWHINMMPRGDGSFYLYLHGHVRTASGTKVEDRVTVEIEFDEKYKNGPLHPMPRWFRSALRSNPPALEAWNKLSPSRKKEVLRYFAGLKSEAARERNLARAISVLSGSAERFMGRLWVAGE